MGRLTANFTKRQLRKANAGCPAIPGTDRTSYHLAYATFSFAHEQQVGLLENKVCGVRE
jgi:hypothetical protein